MSVPTAEYGTNIAFIEDLFERYRRDPMSVSESWREFFQGNEEPEGARGREGEGATAEASPQPAPEAPRPREAQSAQVTEFPRPLSPSPPRPLESKEGDTPVPLRGVASKIVQNMEASLEVPTATSVRVIPVKALEENRRIVNHHLALTGQSKASYTHVIAWAIVKAIREYPHMNS